MIFLLHSYIHIEPAYQEIMSLCPQICLLAFKALFENKRAPKRGINASFQKSLKIPQSWCHKDSVRKIVCRSIGMTCSTRTSEELQRTKKKILEYGRKRVLKGPKIKISKNNNVLLSQGVLCQKLRVLSQKVWPVACEQRDTQRF